MRYEHRLRTLALATVMGPVLACALLQEVRQIASAPRLYHIKNFATDAEMDHLMRLAFADMIPQMRDTPTGIQTQVEIKSDLVAKQIYDRMGSIIPSVGVHDGVLRIRRYLPNRVGYKGGDKHPTHSDWYARMGGMNILSVMLYLTTPEEGGKTRFSAVINHTGYEIDAVRGDVLLWFSCTPSGVHDLESHHSSTAVQRGIKWNAVRFFQADIVQCAREPNQFVDVPPEVMNNTPQSTESIPFGYSVPVGVEVDEFGTREVDDTNSQVDVSEYWGAIRDSEGGAMYETAEADL